MVSTNLQKKK